IIPNRIVYPTLAIALPLLAAAAAIDGRWRPLEHAAIGALVAWGLLLVIHVVSPRGMGFGDVRLAFVLGLFLGWLGLSHVFLGLFLGFLFGAAVGLALIVARRKGRREHIPFGPFLAAGAVVAVVAGSPILTWYRGG